ncbi:MAG: hypothetical protein ACRDJJ_01810, partial [Actinomycetota bacterium]
VFRRKWAEVLEVGPRAEHLPRSMPWVPLLRALTGVSKWLEREADPGWSDYLAASAARSLVEGLARDLEAAGVSLPDPRDFTGAEYWEGFEHLVEEALQMLQPGTS